MHVLWEWLFLRTVIRSIFLYQHLYVDVGHVGNEVALVTCQVISHDVIDMARKNGVSSMF